MGFPCIYPILPSLLNRLGLHTVKGYSRQAYLHQLCHKRQWEFESFLFRLLRAFAHFLLALPCKQSGLTAKKNSVEQGVRHEEGLITNFLTPSGRPCQSLQTLWVGFYTDS